MVWRDNLHSRLVAGMKLFLPLAALGILSTLFLISEKFDPGDAVPPAGIDLQDRAREEGARNAVLSGVTRAGHEVILRSARFVPSTQEPGLLMAEAMSAQIRLNSGAEIAMSALRGEVDETRDSAVLSGQVSFETSTGYAMSTERLLIRYDTLVAESPGPVSGTAPAGRLTAGRMILSKERQTGAGMDLLFTDGVKLIYQSQSSGE